MCLLYSVSFFASIFGFFGVGHLFAGAVSKAVLYLIAGFVWTILAAAIGLSTGFSAFVCFLPLHLIFCHFCSADAVRMYRYPELR